MKWNDHHELEGKHAFLGASQFRWINWSDDAFRDRYYGQYAQAAGTAIHALAHDCICSLISLNEADVHMIDMALYKAGIPLNAIDEYAALLNLIPFINDAIGFHMRSEVVLYYSNFCFGTTDAISVDDKNKVLRIHDLKTGITPAHMEQLYIYAALFFLEYHLKPANYKTILRLYQSQQIVEETPEFMEVERYMDLIVSRSNFAEVLKRSN